MGGAYSTCGRDEKCITNFGRKNSGEESPGRRSCRWEDNIRIHLMETGWEGWVGFIWFMIWISGELL
jgi:hypothetical protein